MKKILSLFFLAVVVAAVAGCARPAARCTGPEDTPGHHYLRGMELLDQFHVEEAEAKFERAVWCDEKYGPGHAGLAITTAFRASEEQDPQFREIETRRALDHLKLARKHADTREETFIYRVASMRTYTELMGKGRLKDVEGSYRAAMKLDVDPQKLKFYQGAEAATYYMGVAYMRAQLYSDARDSFKAVLEATYSSKWHAPAEAGWKKTDKIVRALAGITIGDVGRQIAVKDFVRRGDMAALLVDELKVDKRFAGRIPVKAEGDRKADFRPADVLDSPFREEVETLMKWGVRGLEPEYDKTTRAYLFRPMEPVTRKQFALVVEDVLIKITGDESLGKAFFGHDRSPFPDVPATSAWYNAVMNVTTRSIMETDLSGEFRPDDVVDGAEAILSIRVLRQRLNIN